MVEIMSLLPCGGKTHLLYQLVAMAVIPTNLNGRQAAVVVLDTDGHFEVKRLAQHIRQVVVTHVKEDGVNDDDLDKIKLDCLKHVHVFHPQSLKSTITTLNSLPSYLFDAKKHHSFDRPIGLIALDSASAFYWQARSDAEDSAFQVDLGNTAPSNTSTQYAQLAAALKNATRILAAPAVFTSWDLNSAKSSSEFGPNAHSIKPSLPPPWQTLATLRLVIRRAEVRKLPIEVTVEEALRETVSRQKVVEQGKFQCFVNEWRIDERRLQKMQSEGVILGLSITLDELKISD